MSVESLSSELFCDVDHFIHSLNEVLSGLNGHHVTGMESWTQMNVPAAFRVRSKSAPELTCAKLSLWGWLLC